MSILTKVILITTFIFICLPNSILAQAPDTMWTKTFGGLYSLASLTSSESYDH